MLENNGFTSEDLVQAISTRPTESLIASVGTTALTTSLRLMNPSVAAMDIQIFNLRNEGLALQTQCATAQHPVNEKVRAFYDAKNEYEKKKTELDTLKAAMATNTTIFLSTNRDLTITKIFIETLDQILKCPEDQKPLVLEATRLSLTSTRS